MDQQVLDLSLFAIANLFNLLVAGIFLSRTRRLARAEYLLGLLVMALAVPVAIAATLNALAEREWWAIVLPLPLVLFCLIELLLDYVLKLDFRNTVLLWPYLAVYYLAQWAMIGYSFGVDRVFGFVTLGTYLLCLVVTAYAFSRGGHERGQVTHKPLDS